MNTRFACGLITLLGVLALQPTAHATFHMMQIEQVIGSVNGDTTAQAIQLRMRAAGQNFVSAGKLVVVDAAGLNPITVLDVASNVTHGAVGDHVLICSANFPGHTMPAAVPDFFLANLIPASYFAAGSLMWQSDTGTVFWRLSWGGAAYTGPNTGSIDNDADGNFGPPFPSALVPSCTSTLQFQGSATAMSTNNAADYLSITTTTSWFNNAGTSFSLGVTLPTVTITAPDPNASEFPPDPGRFRITRTGGCIDSTLSIFYAISGTATNGVDYRRLRGNANIQSGATNAKVTVQPIDDTISEPDETVILTLSPNANYIIGSPSTATVTIHSNE